MSTGVASVDFSTAVSNQPAGTYRLKATTAVTGSGEGLAVNFDVEATTLVIKNLNVINRGNSYEVGDTVTIDGHGSSSLLTITALSLAESKSKHSRLYIKVQPDASLGPPTWNLSDQDSI